MPSGGPPTPRSPDTGGGGGGTRGIDGVADDGFCWLGGASANSWCGLSACDSGFCTASNLSGTYKVRFNYKFIDRYSWVQYASIHSNSMMNRARLATRRQHLTHQFMTTCLVTRMLWNIIVNKTTGAFKSKKQKKNREVEQLKYQEEKKEI